MWKWSRDIMWTDRQGTTTTTIQYRHVNLAADGDRKKFRRWLVGWSFVRSFDGHDA